MYRLTLAFALTFLFLPAGVLAQETSAEATATCSFDTEKELTAGYQRVPFNLKKPVLGHEVPYGKVWAPGGKPLTLFTNTPVEIGGMQLPVGAYTMFVVPNPKQWTLIISKSTDMTGKYDDHFDLVRVPMESGELPGPEPQFSAYFNHIAPNQCSLRLDLAKVGNWAVFQKK